LFFISILVFMFSAPALVSGCYGTVKHEEDGDEDGDEDGLPDGTDTDVIPDTDGQDPDGLDVEDGEEVITGTDCLDRGIPDDDQDNISNDMEGGGALDSDYDGTPDSADPDSDNDTIPDVDEAGRTNCTLPPEDFDGDGLPNFRDLDSDGDLIRDEHEGADDSEADGLPDYLDLDSDNDGIDDIEESGDFTLSTPPVDTDGDTMPDFEDVDSDNDGLFDFEEQDLDTDPLAPDSDGDGVDDAFEVMLGFDALDIDDYPQIDMVVELDYGAGETSVDMDVSTDVSRADVYFLIDTTGSMTEELNIITARIRDTIIPQLQGLFSDLEVGVGEFQDECDGDFFPFRSRADITSDASAVQAALAAMAPAGGCGGSVYMEALYYLANGEGTSWTASGGSCSGPYALPDPACGAMRWGYPCFRQDAIPYVVILTDVLTRCDECGQSYTCTFSPLPHAYFEVVNALTEKGIRIVGINSGSAYPDSGGPDLRMLAADTNSVDGEGVAVVYDIPEDGTGLVDSVEDGISKLSFERLMDVLAHAVEFPAVDDGIDARAFVTSITPAGFTLPTPDTPAPTFDADGFFDVTPGTVLSYDVVLENDMVPQGDRMQVFLVEIRALDQNGSRVGTLSLLIVVPGLDLEIIEGGRPVECTHFSDCDDDGLSCTVTACTHGRCNHVPDDSLCDDGNACNGLERCRPDFGYHDASGCIAGLAGACGVTDPCLEASCNSSTGECRFNLVDADGDGFAPLGCRLCDDTGTCVTGDDCNDAVREVNPGATEICDDGVDNDCDRRTDVLDSDCPMHNDNCTLAEVLPGSGTYPGSLYGAADDLATACGPALGLDAVYTITLTGDHDLNLQVLGGMSGFISVRTICGDMASELYCGADRVLARGLSAGTYFIIVEGSSEASFSLSVDVLPYTEVHIVPATNDTCASPYVVPAEGGLFLGSTAGMMNDYTATCGGNSNSADVVFELTLAADKAVTFSTTTDYDGTLHLHDAPCLGTERACNDDSPDTRHSRIDATLTAGTYYLVVDGYSSSSAGSYELEVIVADP
jgi:hypothetical protein